MGRGGVHKSGAVGGVFTGPYGNLWYSLFVYS